MSADYIRALREERESYVARGLDDRVAQVDAELARLEAPASEEAPAEEQAETPDEEAPAEEPESPKRGRAAKPKE